MTTFYSKPTADLKPEEIEQLVKSVSGSVNLLGFEAPLAYAVEQLTRTLRAIASTLQLDVDPTGPPDEVCAAVERAVSAKGISAYLRGQKAAHIAAGRDADTLPESLPERLLRTLLEIEELARTREEGGWEETAREARRRLLAFVQYWTQHT